METISNVIGFLPALIKATPLTLLLTAVAGAFGLVIGTLVALARLSGHRALSVPASVFTFAFRGTPLLVQIYLVYYGLGQILPGTWVRHSFLWPYLRDGLWYAIFALSLNQASYNAEVIRGAIKAVPRGQIEAARSIGMRASMILRRITLPAMLPYAIPGLANLWLIATKDTALLAVVGFNELTQTTRLAAGATKAYFTFFIAAGVLYLMLTLFSNAIIGRIERWARRGMPSVSGSR